MAQDVEQKLGVRITHADKRRMLAKEGEFRHNVKLSHTLRNQVAPVRVREGRWNARDMDTLALKEEHPLLTKGVQKNLGIHIIQAAKQRMLAK